MKRSVQIVTLVCSMALWCVATSLNAENRNWSDLSGKYQVEAEFVGLSDGVVKLRKVDGKVIDVPLKRLSGADRLWISRQQRKNARAQPDTDDRDQTLVATAGWPRWRGPAGDGVSTETGLLKEWPQDGPPLAWSSGGLGGGFSSVVISDGKLFTMGNRRGAKLICVSAIDGSPIWEVNVGGNRDPNGTPTVDAAAGRVYGITFDGVLVCADIETGREVWRKDFQSDLGGRMMSMWGYSESPLIDGDRLICTPGSDNGVMVALDKSTGAVIWQTPMPGGTAGYSSPVISHGGGVKQYVTLVGKGLIGVRAEDGTLLWNYPGIANSTANVPTPIVEGDFVFGSSGYNDGGSALLRLSPSGRGAVRFQQVYYKSNNEVQNHHGGMVLMDGHVYMGHGHNNGFPMCLDLLSGRPKWGRTRGAGKGSAAVVAADGHLYFRYEDAVMALIEATPNDYKLKGSFKIKTNHKQSWSHPVIYDKKLYLRDQDELHCYDIAERA